MAKPATPEPERSSPALPEPNLDSEARKIIRKAPASTAGEPSRPALPPSGL
jgi:hypothetical protein